MGKGGRGEGVGIGIGMEIGMEIRVGVRVGEGVLVGVLLRSSTGYRTSNRADTLSAGTPAEFPIPSNSGKTAKW